VAQQVFTSSGTFTPPAGVSSVDVLIVGGGGAGGATSGTAQEGGGGAGGLRWLTGLAVTPGVGVAVTVGAGGTGGNNGGNSSFGSEFADGGGGGGNGVSGSSQDGKAGGSGGGAAGGSSVRGFGGAGTAGQGNNGGDGTTGASGTRGGGGGGGAGAAGTSATSGNAGDGGAGLNMSAYVGTSVGVSGWFAGGGGGAGTSGAGGQGGGGAGVSSTPGANGIANTGGGGGGPDSTGGSGVVIVVYTVGATIPTGTGTGTFTFTGTGVGSTPGAGSGAGSWTFAGAGVGSKASSGSGTGSWSFVGVGAGSAPGIPVSEGAGTGSWAFVGAGEGTKSTTGEGTGIWEFTGAGVGAHPIAPTEGAGAGTWDFTGTGAGLAAIWGPTETTNRVGGRRRGGYAVATWEPAVVAPPASVVYGEARDVAHAYSTVTMNGTQPVFDVDKTSRTRHRTRVVVGGKDVTFFRGVPTPTPAYQLVSPLLYGPATLRLPQVAAAFEQLGVGDLDWLRTERRVLVQRVDEAGDVVATDYRGVIVAFDTAGADLTVEIGGEASGRAALMERQPPIFRTVNDIGAHAYYAIRALGLPFTPRLGPDTGISLARFGGTGHLDYISQLCARAWTQSGNQWTIMPSTDTGAYRMVRKDTTTIDATAYLDDAYTVGSLRRDLAEEPNRLYATGVTPEGQRVRFGAYPGLKQGAAAPYPFNNNRNFGLGTTNADTDTGDGITVMIDKLRVHKYMNAIDQPGGYDNDAEKGVRQLQDDAGLPVTGTMTPATWRALFDLDATGFSLRQSQIMPAAQKTYTKQWHRSGAGAQIRKNPNYDKRRLKRDRTVDMGPGFTVAQMREFARAEIDASNDDNWVGQIVFHTGALVAGDHTPGTPVAPSDIFRARALRPGMNLSLPLFDGGIVVHVSAVSVGEDGTVTATVDTRARDSMAVWEVIQRNRESRRNPARQWVRDHRASGEIKDAIDGWDEVGGLLGDNVTVPGHRWTIFEVVAGQEGTVARLSLRTNPNAEFVCAVFGRVFDADAMEKRLRRRVGNPLTKRGSKKWEDEDVRDDLDANNFLLYVAGSNEDPCGYYPKHKRPEVVITDEANPDYDPTADTDSTGLDDEPTIEVESEGASINPLTGRWKDDAQFGYRTFAQPVLYVAMYADRDTVVPAGRIMWPQLEAGA